MAVRRDRDRKAGVIIRKIVELEQQEPTRSSAPGFEVEHSCA